MGTSAVVALRLTLLVAAAVRKAGAGRAITATRVETPRHLRVPFGSLLSALSRWNVVSLVGLRLVSRSTIVAIDFWCVLPILTHPWVVSCNGVLRLGLRLGLNRLRLGLNRLRLVSHLLRLAGHVLALIRLRLADHGGLLLCLGTILARVGLLRLTLARVGLLGLTCHQLRLMFHQLRLAIVSLSLASLIEHSCLPFFVLTAPRICSSRLAFSCGALLRELLRSLITLRHLILLSSVEI